MFASHITLVALHCMRIQLNGKMFLASISLNFLTFKKDKANTFTTKKMAMALKMLDK